MLPKLPVTERERVKIAEEGLNLYSLLAPRMGLMKVKGEIEDLAFQVTNPLENQRTSLTHIAANQAYHEAATLIDDILSDPVIKKISPNASFSVEYRIKVDIYFIL